MDATGLIPEFRGIVVHDAWAPYDTYDHDARLVQRPRPARAQAVMDASPAGQWCWAAQAADALREMKRLADAVLATDGTRATLTRRNCLDPGIATTPRP
jgi:transposase